MRDPDCRDEWSGPKAERAKKETTFPDTLWLFDTSIVRLGHGSRPGALVTVVGGDPYRR